MKKTYVINNLFTHNHVMKIRNSEVDEVILTKNCIDSTSVYSLQFLKKIIRIYKPHVKFILTPIKKDWAVKRLLDSDDIILI